MTTPPDTTAAATPPDASVDLHELRRFNRFWVNLVCSLDFGRHLHVPFTDTEARVMYELARRQRVDSADLRVTLSLDAGYLSRLLRGFEDRLLITRARSEEDRRRQRIMLTPSAGRRPGCWRRVPRKPRPPC